MITISKSYSFDSAHQLYRDDWTVERNQEVFGKCARPHGHTYTLNVFFSGEPNPGTGMVINFFDVDSFMKPIVQQLDHQDLNKVFKGMLTTSENMVKEVSKWLVFEAVSRDIHLQQVELSETPRTKAIWTP